MCPYHSDSCNNNVVIDNPLCLIKLLSKWNIHTINV
jgi:hypothetical protein